MRLEKHFHFFFFSLFCAVSPNSHAGIEFIHWRHSSIALSTRLCGGAHPVTSFRWKFGRPSRRAVSDTTSARQSFAHSPPHIQALKPLLLFARPMPPTFTPRVAIATKSNSITSGRRDIGERRASGGIRLMAEFIKASSLHAGNNLSG